MDATHLLAAGAAAKSVSPAFAAGTAATVFVVVGAITVVEVWKIKKASRSAGFLALIAGLAGAGIVVAWLGALSTTQIFGVGIFTVLALVGLRICWHELVKKRDLHRFRTPLVAFITGVALMNVGGVIGHAAQAADQHATNTVSRVTQSGTGG